MITNKLVPLGLGVELFYTCASPADFVKAFFADYVQDPKCESKCLMLSKSLKICTIDAFRLYFEAMHIYAQHLQNHLVPGQCGSVTQSLLSSNSFLFSCASECDGAQIDNKALLMKKVFVLLLRLLPIVQAIRENHTQSKGHDDCPVELSDRILLDLERYDALSTAIQDVLMQRVSSKDSDDVCLPSSLLPILCMELQNSRQECSASSFALLRPVSPIGENTTNFVDATTTLKVELSNAVYEYFQQEIVGHEEKVINNYTQVQTHYFEKSHVRIKLVSADSFMKICEMFQLYVPSYLNPYGISDTCESVRLIPNDPSSLAGGYQSRLLSIVASDRTTLEYIYQTVKCLISVIEQLSIFTPLDLSTTFSAVQDQQRNRCVSLSVLQIIQIKEHELLMNRYFTDADGHMNADHLKSHVSAHKCLSLLPMNVSDYNSTIHGNSPAPPDDLFFHPWLVILSHLSPVVFDESFVGVHEGSLLTRSSTLSLITAANIQSPKFTSFTSVLRRCCAVSKSWFFMLYKSLLNPINGSPILFRDLLEIASFETSVLQFIKCILVVVAIMMVSLGLLFDFWGFHVAVLYEKELQVFGDDEYWSSNNGTTLLSIVEMTPSTISTTVIFLQYLALNLGLCDFQSFSGLMPSTLSQIGSFNLRLGEEVSLETLNHYSQLMPLSSLEKANLPPKEAPVMHSLVPDMINLIEGSKKDNTHLLLHTRRSFFTLTKARGAYMKDAFLFSVTSILDRLEQIDETWSARNLLSKFLTNRNDKSLISPEHTFSGFDSRHCRFLSSAVSKEQVTHLLRAFQGEFTTEGAFVYYSFCESLHMSETLWTRQREVIHKVSSSFITNKIYNSIQMKNQQWLNSTLFRIFAQEVSEVSLLPTEEEWSSLYSTLREIEEEFTFLVDAVPLFGGVFSDFEDEAVFDHSISSNSATVDEYIALFDNVPPLLFELKCDDVDWNSEGCQPDQRTIDEATDIVSKSLLTVLEMRSSILEQRLWFEKLLKFVLTLEDGPTSRFLVHSVKYPRRIDMLIALGELIHPSNVWVHGGESLQHFLSSNTSSVHGNPCIETTMNVAPNRTYLSGEVVSKDESYGVTRVWRSISAALQRLFNRLDNSDGDLPTLRDTRNNEARGVSNCWNMAQFCDGNFYLPHRPFSKCSPPFGSILHFFQFLNVSTDPRPSTGIGSTCDTRLSIATEATAKISEICSLYSLLREEAAEAHLAAKSGESTNYTSNIRSKSLQESVNFSDSADFYWPIPSCRKLDTEGNESIQSALTHCYFLRSKAIVDAFAAHVHVDDSDHYRAFQQWHTDKMEELRGKEHPFNYFVDVGGTKASSSPTAHFGAWSETTKRTLRLFFSIAAAERWKALQQAITEIEVLLFDTGSSPDDITAYGTVDCNKTRTVSHCVSSGVSSFAHRKLIEKSWNEILVSAVHNRDSSQPNVTLSDLIDITFFGSPMSKETVNLTEMPRMTFKLPRRPSRRFYYIPSQRYSETESISVTCRFTENLNLINPLEAKRSSLHGRKINISVQLRWLGLLELHPYEGQMTDICLTRDRHMSGSLSSRMKRVFSICKDQSFGWLSIPVSQGHNHSASYLSPISILGSILVSLLLWATCFILIFALLRYLRRLVVRAALVEFFTSTPARAKIMTSMVGFLNLGDAVQLREEELTRRKEKWMQLGVTQLKMTDNDCVISHGMKWSIKKYSPIFSCSLLSLLKRMQIQKTSLFPTISYEVNYSWIEEQGYAITSMIQKMISPSLHPNCTELPSSDPLVNYCFPSSIPKAIQYACIHRLRALLESEKLRVNIEGTDHTEFEINISTKAADKIGVCDISEPPYRAYKQAFHSLKDCIMSDGTPFHGDDMKELKRKRNIIDKVMEDVSKSMVFSYPLKVYSPRISDGALEKGSADCLTYLVDKRDEFYITTSTILMNAFKMSPPIGRKHPLDLGRSERISQQLEVLVLMRERGDAIAFDHDDVVRNCLVPLPLHEDASFTIDELCDALIVIEGLCGIGCLYNGSEDTSGNSVLQVITEGVLGDGATINPECWTRKVSDSSSPIFTNLPMSSLTRPSNIMIRYQFFKSYLSLVDILDRCLRPLAVPISTYQCRTKRYTAHTESSLSRKESISFYSPVALKQMEKEKHAASEAALLSDLTYKLLLDEEFVGQIITPQLYSAHQQTPEAYHTSIRSSVLFDGIDDYEKTLGLSRSMNGVFASYLNYVALLLQEMRRSLIIRWSLCESDALSMSSESCDIYEKQTDEKYEMFNAEDEDVAQIVTRHRYLVLKLLHHTHHRVQGYLSVVSSFKRRCNVLERRTEIMREAESAQTQEKEYHVEGIEASQTRCSSTDSYLLNSMDMKVLENCPYIMCPH